MNKNLKALIFSFLFLSPFLMAAQIKQIKNKKALIQLDGMAAKVGDQFYGLNKAQKKTSLLQISTVKNGKAIAQVLKGAPAVSDTLQLKSTATSAASTVSHTPRLQSADTGLKNRSSLGRKDLKKLSFNIKISSDSITTKQQDPTAVEETVEMPGTNFGFNAQYDIPINDWLAIKGFAGLEMLKVAKMSTLANTCDDKTSSDCNVSINYLTFGGLLKAGMPLLSQSLIWGGLGAGFKQPITKKSTALTEENIALANVLIVAFGIDYHLSAKSFIPISFEYQKSFNESETVPSIKHMGLNIGYGFTF